MAYASKELAQKIRKLLKENPVTKQFTSYVRIEHHSKVIIRIAKGPVDFVGCEQVNHYHIGSSDRPDLHKAILEEFNKILHCDHWDKSDVQTDYFHCAYYAGLHIGKWDKAYKHNGKAFDIDTLEAVNG